MRNARLVAGLVVLASCGSQGTVDPREQPPLAPDTLRVSPQTLAVDIGEVTFLTARLLDKAGAPLEGTVQWVVRDTTKVRPITTMELTAPIVPVAVGTTHVVAATTTGASDSCRIVVTGAVLPPAPPTPPPDTACDTAKISLTLYANFEDSGPDRWGGLDTSQAGARLSTITSHANECLQASRFELRRTDLLIAGSHRTQVQIQKGGFSNGSVSVPSEQTVALTRGSETWWGFSIFVPGDWIFETGYAPETIFELVEGFRTPPIALNINAGSWEILTQTGHGPQGDPSWVPTYSRHPITRGVWTDFVFHVKASANSDGLFQVWISGVLVRDQTGPNIYSDGYRFVKPLWGIYKWSWNAAPSGGGSIVSSRVLYLDNIRVTDGEHGFYELVSPR